MVAEQPFRSTLDVTEEHIQRVGEQSSELLVEERNLLSLVYKDAVGSRHAAWCVIRSVEQREKFKGKGQLASHAKEYVAKVEGGRRGGNPRREGGTQEGERREPKKV